MTHTPGPWDASEGNCVTAENGRIGIAITDPCPTMPGFWVDADPVMGEEESLANTRLIAAAPDLLAACKALFNVGDLDPKNAPAILHHLRNATKLARAAVAKAEGA